MIEEEKGSSKTEAMQQISHLYIHIPFCERRCSYCDFYSQAGVLGRSSDYIDALLKEADSFGDRLSGIETVYLGGGTPTLLDGALLARLLAGLDDRLKDGAEITIEANPSTIYASKAERLLDCGVNRVSLGIQSCDERLLENLGRKGRSRVAEEAVRELRAAGFENISLDMIFGIPTQTYDQLNRDLESVLMLAPKHISYYELSAKDGSEYRRKWARELEIMRKNGADFYELVVNTLELAGFVWYETSSFALPGRECRHNLAYWDGSDFVGLGAGAWSTMGLKRWRNAEDLDLYIEGAPGPAGSRLMEELSVSEKKSELLFLGLRRDSGAPRSPVAEVINREAEKSLLENGFLINEGGKIKLTRPGRMVANDVCARLLQE
jgi:oxygen-independent coproporphyrinogen-3 oxidase